MFSVFIMFISITTINNNIIIDLNCNPYNMSNTNIPTLIKMLSKPQGRWRDESWCLLFICQCYIISIIIFPWTETLCLRLSDTDAWMSTTTTLDQQNSPRLVSERMEHSGHHSSAPNESQIPPEPHGETQLDFFHKLGYSTEQVHE